MYSTIDKPFYAGTSAENIGTFVINGISALAEMVKFQNYVPI